MNTPLTPEHLEAIRKRIQVRSDGDARDIGLLLEALDRLTRENEELRTDSKAWEETAMDTAKELSEMTAREPLIQEINRLDARVLALREGLEEIEFGGAAAGVPATAIERLINICGIAKEVLAADDKTSKSTS